jgi:hypothetical protein
VVDLVERFDGLVRGNTFFLVTDFGELDRQPELKKELARFAIYSQGDGYVLYDLQKAVQ